MVWVPEKRFKEGLGWCLKSLLVVERGGGGHNRSMAQRSKIKRLDELREKRDAILSICARHGARNVRLFGSIVRGEADEASDIDLIVTFEPGRSLLDHAALTLELEALLGCRVDVVSDRGIKPRIRERILKEMKPL